MKKFYTIFFSILFVVCFSLLAETEISEDRFIDVPLTHTYSEPLPPVPEPTAQVAEEDVIILAKLMYGECRGISDKNMQAAVCWVALNRLDNGKYGNTLEEVVISSGHFSGYKHSNPIWENLYELAKDVLINYELEKIGYSGCYRVIPREYLWFYGNGQINIFRDAYHGGNTWDWSTNYYGDN